MMNQQAALDKAKDMLAKGELPDVAAANVMVVKLMGIKIIHGSLPRDVRSAYMSAVKAGELGRLPKRGLAPEVFFHKNARGTAIEAQEREFRAAVEALRKVYATPTLYIVKGDTKMNATNQVTNQHHTTTSDLITFIVGESYFMRSIGDADCIWICKVLSRTAKQVTVQVDGRIVKKGVKVYDGVECCFPLGSYAKAPKLRADKVSR